MRAERLLGGDEMGGTHRSRASKGRDGKQDGFERICLFVQVPTLST